MPDKHPQWMRILLMKLAQKQIRIVGSAGWYSLSDFRKQLRSMQDVDQYEIVKRIPGVMELTSEAELADARECADRVAGIIDAMTMAERETPSIIDAMRCARIARGSGTGASEVTRLLIDFQKMRQMVFHIASHHVGPIGSAEAAL